MGHLTSAMKISWIRRVIKKRIIQNVGISLNKIASDLDISRGSVQNIVKCELGLRSYRLLQRHTLTDKAEKNRLERAKKLLCHLRTGRLYNILFTDEKIFTMEAAPNSQDHQQLLSTSGRNSGKRRIRTRTLFPKSVMVWGGICATGRLRPFFFSKKESKSMPGTTKMRF